MNLKLFAVWDSKANFFGTPFSDQSESSAIRNFSDAVNDGSNPNNMWHKHPEDFSLFYLGDFDTNSGEILPNLPKNLITASALKALDYSDGSNAIKIHDRNGESSEKQISDELRVLKNSEGIKSS